jgi:hypothetical protein
LCKFFHAPDTLQAKLLANTASAFNKTYLKYRSISDSLGRHVALIALARVEGKSPVNYLNQAQQRKLQSHTKVLLSSKAKVELSNLFEMSMR